MNNLKRTHRLILTLDTASLLLDQNREADAFERLEGLEDDVQALIRTAQQMRDTYKQAQQTNRVLSDELIVVLAQFVEEEKKRHRQMADATVCLTTDRKAIDCDHRSEAESTKAINALHSQILDICGKMYDASHISGKDFIPIYGPGRRIAVSVEALGAVLNVRPGDLYHLQDRLNACQRRRNTAAADDAAMESELAALMATLDVMKVEVGTLDWLQPKITEARMAFAHQVADAADINVHYRQIATALQSVEEGFDSFRTVSRKLKRARKIHRADGKLVDGTLQDAMLALAVEADQCHADVPGALLSIEGLYPTGAGDDRKVAQCGTRDKHYQILESKGRQVDGDPDVTRTFRLTFHVDVIPDSCMILGGWAVGNAGVDILINGQGTGQTIAAGCPPFQSLTPFSINHGVKRGCNTLDFVVKDQGCNAGLQVANIMGVVEGHTPSLLVFKTTSDFTKVWRDQGSGALSDGAFYRTNPPAGFFSIGDYGQSNYQAPDGRVIVVQAGNEDVAEPLLVAPIGYRQISNNRGSSAEEEGSFWLPLAPQGYVSIGCVVQRGYDEPDIANYRCIRADQVEPGTLGGLIYKDLGSGAAQDMANYWLTDTNVLSSKRGYSPPSDREWKPREMYLRANR
tara:strand:+ start:39444 stop:41333 length:1890 start_codon:yes stop_codon:yes gene_type:complete